MASRVSCWWACLCVLWLRDVSVASPRYAVHSRGASFRDALKTCAPGTLTPLSTRQELDQVLELVSPHEDLTFWVGLKKNNTECVDRTLTLRGFRWTETGLQDSDPIPWVEEPTETCTEIRCAALMKPPNGSGPASWGLISVTCKNQYRFICKHGDGQVGGSPGTRTPEPDLQSPGPSSGSGPCAEGFHRDPSGLCVDVDECSHGHVCRHTCVNTEGSYRCVDQAPPPPSEGVLSGVLVPALVAVAVLVLVVLVVLVTVKCCLVRRAKRRAARNALKMAMKSKHEKTSKETANEKAAT